MPEAIDLTTTVDPDLTIRNATPSPAARMLDEFHGELGDQNVSARESATQAHLRTHLHDEEHAELRAELEQIAADCEAGQAPSRETLEHLVRELADTIYITYGTARAFGLDLDTALAEVHRANMTKLFPPNGVPRQIRDDGKLLKPPGFQPPDMRAAVPGD